MNIFIAVFTAASVGVISIISRRAVRVGPGCLFAIRMGFGLIGVWSAYILDIILRSGVLLLRFRRERWAEIQNLSGI